MLKLKPSYPSQGFTLIEVLVSILIVTFFVTVSMQGMVISAVFKARAKQYTEATNLIQQDLENVKLIASQLQSTTLAIDVEPGQTTIRVPSALGLAVGNRIRVGTDVSGYTISNINTTTNPITITLSSSLRTAKSTNLQVAAAPSSTSLSVFVVGGFVVGDRIKIGTGSGTPIKTITAINPNSNPPTFTLDSALGGTTTYPINTSIALVQKAGGFVSAIERCADAIPAPTITTGFGAFLNSHLASNVPVATASGYTLSRGTPTVKNTVPYETLQITYSVTPAGRSNILATIPTEVIPDAAFKCP